MEAITIYVYFLYNANENPLRNVSLTAACSTGNKKIPVFRYILASGKPENQLLVQLAPGSIVDIHDICFRLVESGILNQSLETVVFAAAVFDVHQHTELVLKWKLPEFGIIQLVTECICHSCIFDLAVIKFKKQNKVIWISRNLKVESKCSRFANRTIL